MTILIPVATIMRHNKKEYQADVAGSEEDLAIRLNDKGYQNAVNMGKFGGVIPAGTEHVDLSTSDFKRAQDQADAVLKGAGFDPYDSNAVGREELTLLGFAGDDYSHPSVPDFRKDDDAYLNAILTSCYFPKEGRPFSAKWAFATLNLVCEGVERQLRNGAGIHTLISTHSDVIDIAAAKLGDYHTVFPDEREGCLGPEFPGRYGASEVVKVYRPVDGSEKSDNPKLVVQGKGREGRVLQTTWTLDEIKELRDDAEEHMRMPVD